MADKFADAPIGATHVSTHEHPIYYRFDGHVWKFWFVDKWKRCEDNQPARAVTPLPPRTATPPEHTLCCGTTCDKQAVNRYIKQLEAVAESAQRASDELRKLLEELGK